MELGIGNRLMLLSILSGCEGNLTELRVLRELESEVSFSDEEIVTFGLVQEETPTGGRAVWNQAKEQPKDIQFGDAAKGIIVRKLKELNRQGKLQAGMLDLVDKFPEVEG